MSAVLVTGPTAMQNQPFLRRQVAKTNASTHSISKRRDSQALKVAE